MSRFSYNAVSLSLVLIAGLASRALANDGGIAFGGSPRLLNGHPTVAMRSETIHMLIGDKNVTTDCTFVFFNAGPACKVRMGFPDQGEGASDPDEEKGENWAKLPPATTFTSFRSYVNGKEVATRLIRANEEGKYWHEKTVVFPSHSSLIVRDIYTQPVGAQISEVSSQFYQASYILHTGASWHGRIGRTEVDITFNRRGMIPPLQPVAITPKEYETKVMKTAWWKDKGRVFYLGPVQPVVVGNMLKFVRNDWRPAPSDDIRVYFDLTKPSS